MGLTMKCIVLLLTCMVSLVLGDPQESYHLLDSRIETLEKQGNVLMTYIQILEGQIEQQSKHARSQQEEMLELKEHMDRQNLVIEQLQQEHSNNHHGNRQQPNYVNSGSSKNKLLNTLIEAKSRQSRLLLDPSEHIVFYAKIAKPSLDHIAVNQTIVFDADPTNLGGGYSTQTGIFTVPRQGIYLLSTSFVSYLQHHHEIHVAIMHNGQEIGRVVAHGDSGHLDQGSTVVVTPLNAGDKVWLKNIGDPDNSLGGQGYSNFMGALLYVI